MSVGSGLSKAESWKVSPAVAGFLNTQLCASGAEALLLGTATLCGRTRDLDYCAEPQQKLLISIPCSFAAVPWQSFSLHLSLLEA